MKRAHRKCDACGVRCGPQDVSWRRRGGKSVQVCGHCGAVFGQTRSGPVGGDGFGGVMLRALSYPLSRSGLLHLVFLSGMSLVATGLGGLFLGLLFQLFWVTYLFTVIRIAAVGGDRFPGAEEIGGLSELLVHWFRYTLASFVTMMPLIITMFFVKGGILFIAGLACTVILMPAMLASAAMGSGFTTGINPIPALLLIRRYPLQYMGVLLFFVGAVTFERWLREASSTEAPLEIWSLAGLVGTPVSLYLAIVSMRALGGLVYWVSEND